MTYLFLTVRALHVLCGALWLGSVAFVSLILMPAIEQLGADGGKVMSMLVRKGISTFIASIAGLTVLSGLGLYYHLTAGFDPTLSGSREAIVFGVGGLLGLAAAIIGGAIVGRSAKKAADLGNRLASADAAQRTTIGAEIARLRQRLTTFGHLVLALLIAAAILMAIGHYV